jgi:glycosyltransferase involved in cell wall biosynthesis
MKLHLLGIPHTYTHPKFSCCAFTGKVLRFSPMMQSVGYHVVHYGNAGSESGANEEVEILNKDEYKLWGGSEPGNTQYGSNAHIGSDLYREFNKRLAYELENRVEEGDIICFPFGRAHADAVKGPKAQKAYWLETGVGYRNSFAPFRVFESHAWLNLTAGREYKDEVAMGQDYWWRIFNYYDPDDWPLVNESDLQANTINFMGRLNDDKGLNIIEEIAKRRPSIQFNLCGQGDASKYITKNVRAYPAIHGDRQDDRALYLGEPSAVIVPSRYIEPFGGVAAEALLCGTPVITSAFGAFQEYVSEGETGWMCRTLKDWLTAVDIATSTGTYWRRPQIQARAQHMFSMWNRAKDYDKVFKQLIQLSKGGWFATTSEEEVPQPTPLVNEKPEELW